MDQVELIAVLGAVAVVALAILVIFVWRPFSPRVPEGEMPANKDASDAISMSGHLGGHHFSDSGRAEASD